MKKIFSVILLLLLFVTSCSKKGQTNFTKLCDYVEQLDSYELDAKMSIYRQNNEIKTNVHVCYLRPNYYKVTFDSENGYDQIILKNNEGVFVLTPSINKEFKFDSNWPLNSSHAYLITSIVKDLKNDKNVVVETKDNILEAKASLSTNNPNFKTLIFKYNVKENKPISVSFNNSNEEKVIFVEFTKFEANKKLSKDDFNKDLIMNEEGSINDTNNTSSLVVSYVIAGATLKSSKQEDNYYIMCYQGEKDYTIVIKDIELDYNDVLNENFDEIVYDSVGLIVSNDNCYKCYVNDKEIIVFSNNLSSNEVILIINGIELS